MIEEYFPIDKFKKLQTPFYYYDTKLLQDTLDILKTEIEKYGYQEHYAVKANANPRILKIIAQNGLGADCVSGGEIRAALDAGFPASKIVFAGVGKADWEISLGLENEIACFNVESLVELEVINDIAEEKRKVATIAFRVNPNIDAHTHAKITTGLKENKFGIDFEMLDSVIEEMKKMKNVRFSGLHFHIGSQITDLSVFRDLCIKAQEVEHEVEKKGLTVDNLNFGGGLGIDYYSPNHPSIPEFESFFKLFHQLIKQKQGRQIRFELGRSVVAQCGSLISKVLYVKKGVAKQFAILDAGFSELIRPAMYDVYHHIENITNNEEFEIYDVVGPICESSDVFAKDRKLNTVHRHDLIALRSAGAYGEIMASHYNCRPHPKSYFSDEL